MKVLEFLNKEPLLPYIVRAMEVIIPIASITGIVVMPDMLAVYTFTPLMFLLCLVLAANSIVLPIIVLEKKQELDWLYSCHLAITAHKVFRGGELVYRPSIQAIVLGAFFAFVHVTFKSAERAIEVIALFSGILAFWGLLIVAFWYVWLMFQFKKRQNQQVNYSYWAFDRKTGNKHEGIACCYLRDLRDCLAVKDLEYMLGEREHETELECDAGRSSPDVDQRAIESPRGGGRIKAKTSSPRGAHRTWTPLYFSGNFAIMNKY